MISGVAGGCPLNNSGREDVDAGRMFRKHVHQEGGVQSFHVPGDLSPVIGGLIDRKRGISPKAIFISIRATDSGPSFVPNPWPCSRPPLWPPPPLAAHDIMISPCAGDCEGRTCCCAIARTEARGPSSPLPCRGAVTGILDPHSERPEEQVGIRLPGSDEDLGPRRWMTEREEISLNSSSNLSLNSKMIRSGRFPSLEL